MLHHVPVTPFKIEIVSHFFCLSLAWDVVATAPSTYCKWISVSKKFTAPRLVMHHFIRSTQQCSDERCQSTLKKERMAHNCNVETMI
eukprot:scaffold4880_cov106-Cylindrotheca_fusiformis.AAC.11